MTTCIVDFDTKTIYTDDLQTRYHKEVTTSSFGFKKVSRDVGLGFAPTEKIRMTANGCTVVAAGCATTLDEFARGYPNKIPKAPKSNTTILVCQVVGDTFRVISYQSRVGVFRNRWEIDVISPLKRHIAIGSGSEYAAGALAAGATPENAIIAASKLDHYTSANVTGYKVVDPRTV
ncbi:MAG: hypothetical protein CMF22_11710 [Idiomarinaceae bacterium]|nr:hypothetical protein [Idiomarinaceae bacterium]|tara:strand:- start:51506 stop:52033 length:528 start_codon:yes stop_codon:yes gene_type:complete